MTTKRIFTPEEAQKKYDALPTEIKSLLYTPEVTSIIQKVGEKNKLHFDQMGVLELETSSVMLGFTDTADYEQIIAEKLNVDAKKAAEIVKDINDMLFVKIRNSLKIPLATAAAKSVVMPSSLAEATAATPVVTTPAAVPPAPATSKTPGAAPTMPTAPLSNQISTPLDNTDIMLSEPTVSLPKKVEMPPSLTTKVEATSPASPGGQTKPPSPAPAYKADPYREPIE